MRIPLGALAIAALVAAGAGCGSDEAETTSTGEPATGVTECSDIVTGGTVSNVAVLNMECADAEKVIGSFATIGREFEASSGFTCSRVSGGRLSGAWGCTSGDREFSFDFAD